MPDSQKDLRKKLLGKKGETATIKYLKKHGALILERNYSTPFGEADIIAELDDQILFVEVKTRSSDEFGLPQEAVGKQKQDRYRKIAKFYWLRTGREPNARFV